MAKQKQKKKTGRPQTFTSLQQQAILASIRSGMSIRSACERHSVPLATCTSHARRNPSFAYSLKQARAECEEFLLGRIYNGAQNWQSSAWMLERIYRGRYTEHRKKSETKLNIEAPTYEIVGGTASRIKTA